MGFTLKMLEENSQTEPCNGIMGNNIFISNQCIKRSDIIEAIEAISEISPNIGLSGGYQYDEALLERLIEIKAKKGLNLLIHGYFPPPMEHFVLNFANTGEQTRDFVRETMKFIRALDIEYYSVHAGFKRDFDIKDEILLNPKGQQYTLRGIYENIEWFTKEFPDKKLALENLYPNNQDTDTCLLMHIDEIVELINMNENAYFLLDLGHLKISSRLLGFDYLDAVDILFEKHGSRILEIHLSENNAGYDDHFLVYPDNIQHKIVKKYAHIINRNRINIVIESRNSSMDGLFKCHFIINEALTSNDSRFTTHDSLSTSRFLKWHDSYIKRSDRNKLNNHKSGLLWFTGLSAAGKSTIAHAVERELFNQGVRTYVLDGDNIRHGLNANLGFSPEDRKENIRRIGEVARLMVDAGIIVLAAFISPYREDRDAVRRLFAGDNFAEIYVKCSIGECERRDPKGQYKKARAGIIKNYTGISSPYEEPENPDLVINTELLTVEEAVKQVITFLKEKDFIGCPL